MSSKSWENLQKIIVIFGFVYFIGILIPLIIAILFGRVTPYVPYISDCGAYFPEGGLFSCFLMITAILSQSIMVVRWFIVNEMNSKEKNLNLMFLNSVGMMLGTFFTLALIFVAAFPTTSLSNVHNTASGTSLMCIVLYMLIQTWISFKLSGEVGQNVSQIRLGITIISFICCIMIAVFGVLGSTIWNTSHSVGVKTPKDEGFYFYVISASAEWILAILFFSYYATFYQEFKRSVFVFRLVQKKVPKPLERVVG